MTINCLRTPHIHESALIHDTALIEAQDIVIEAGAQIGANVKLKAKKIHIGFKTRIENGCSVSAVGGDPAEEVSIGDFSFLGQEIQIIVPTFRVGDYTAIHQRTFITGYEPCVLGHNCWVGQDTILNSTGRLTIGDNVRIGTRSQIWTHVESGELLEGCTLYDKWPLTIENDVWLVGSAIVSVKGLVPKRTVILTGSVLSKCGSEEGHTYSGTPAKDITDKLNFWKPKTPQEKFTMMQGFAKEFLARNQNIRSEQIVFKETIPSCFDAHQETILILMCGEAQDLGPKVSVFSLETKRYTKRRTTLEEKFIRFHVGSRARFIPLETLP